MPDEGREGRRFIMNPIRSNKVECRYGVVTTNVHVSLNGQDKAINDPNLDGINAGILKVLTTQFIPSLGQVIEGKDIPLLDVATSSCSTTRITVAMASGKDIHFDVTIGTELNVGLGPEIIESLITMQLMPPVIGNLIARIGLNQLNSAMEEAGFAGDIEIAVVDPQDRQPQAQPQARPPVTYPAGVSNNPVGQYL